MKFVNVALPVPKRSVFTYSIPEGVVVQDGLRLLIPFRNKRVVGYTINITNSLSAGLNKDKIKNIESVLDAEPVLSEPLIKLVKWMSSYYFSPIGEVIKSMLPNYLNKIKIPTLRINDSKRISISTSKEFPKLNEDQLGVLKAINSFEKPYLLYGITGSGKTEVYISLAEKLLKEGKGSIILVPEIGLTTQQIDRFASRLGIENVAVYHSGLTDSQRYYQWQKIKSGEAKIVIGTRSAIFAPVKNLGAIIVDEEHDGSYKQEEGMKYHARDTAVVRGQYENVIVILGSATPSVQSMYNAKSGKYKLLELKTRPTGSLPEVKIVDLKNVERFRNFISAELSNALDECKTNGNQAIVFLNRRGFASQVLCKDCGFIYECPNCDIALTYHKNKNSNSLICHYCGYQTVAPDVCCKCESSMLILMGKGTQRIEGEICRRCENSKITRLDSDSANAKERREILDKMDKGKIDILIGTQMVTKGHDFPKLQLVGVAFADTSLYFPDFRAPERTFQLISQVAGRAGRREHSSSVIVQTYQPEHYAILAAKEHNYTSFYEKEIEHRRELDYPPFTRLASIRIFGNVESNVVSAIKSVAIFLRNCKVGSVSILGPVSCPQKKIRGKFRWYLLLKSKSPKALSDLLNRLVDNEDKLIKKNVNISIDVDPITLL